MSQYKILTIVRPFAGVAFLIILWEAVCDILHIPIWMLPSPSEVLRAGYELVPLLPGNVIPTLTEIIAGFLLSVVVGIPLAIIVTFSTLGRSLVYPLILTLQSVPKIALAPLLLLWVGYGLNSAIVVAAATAFFPIVVSTSAGLESTDRELLELTRSFKSGKIKVFFKVRLPWAMPHIFSGFKVAITLSVIGAVVAEFIGSSHGLGYLILVDSGQLKTAAVFASIIMLSIVSVALFYGIELLEKMLCPWYAGQKNRQ